MSNQPTPETDAIEQGMFGSDSKLIADFARRLERERDDLLDRLTALEHSMPIELATLERERDEARDVAKKAKAYKRVLKEDNAKLRRELAAERALADRLANALMACERWVNQPCDVKTEANKALMEWKKACK